MNPGFQEGRRPRANAVASLANTGHVSPLARRPSTGAVGHAHLPGQAGRPGPRPMSAKTATAVNVRNNATRGAMQQMVRKTKSLVRLPTLPYNSYKPGASGREPWIKGTDETGQTWFHTQVQELWVYSHQIDHYGTMEFRVYNPKTKLWAAFTPDGYFSGESEFKAIASGTGEFGRVYGNTLAVTAATLGTFGIAAEFEIGAAVLTSTRGVLIRFGSFAGGQATRFGAKIAQEFTLKNFLLKSGIDLSVQFGSGLLTKGSVRESFSEINVISLLVAGLLPGEGWGPAFRNSALTSTVKVGGKFDKRGQLHPYFKLPDFTSAEGVGKYMLDLVGGVVSDKMKGVVAGEAAPLFRMSTRALAQSESAFWRWFSVQRITLGTMGTVVGGSTVDSAKDQIKDKMEGTLPKAEKPKPKKP